MKSIFLRSGSLLPCIILYFLPFVIHAQSFSGRVTDIYHIPLAGSLVTVQANDGSALFHYTDDDGYFILEGIPFGKLDLEIVKEGFTTLYLTTSYQIQSRDLLHIIMEKKQNVILDSLTVFASAQLAEFDGSIRMNRSQYKTMAGSFQDPSRVLLHFPGFSTDNDGTNSFFFRGMPGYTTHWQFFDSEIINPNHLTTAGNRGDALSVNSGGVNVLSSSVIGDYSFQPSVSSIRQNNSVGGISHIQLANTMRNFTDLSLIGAEAGFGFKNKNKYTYATARYSFVGLLEKLGVPFGNESINYQDFSLVSDLIKNQNTSVKGYIIYGQSSNIHRALPVHDTKTSFKDLQDITYKSNLGIAGFAGNYRMSKTKFIDFTLNYSLRNDINESSVSPLYPSYQQFMNDNQKNKISLTSAHLRYQQIHGIHHVSGGIRTSVANHNLTINGFIYPVSHVRFYPYAEYKADWKNWQWTAGLALNSFVNRDNKWSNQINYSVALEKKFLNRMYLRLAHRYVDQHIVNSSLFYNYIHIKSFTSEISAGKSSRTFSWRISGFYNDLRDNNTLITENGDYLSTFNGLDYGLENLESGVTGINSAKATGVEWWCSSSFSLGRNVLEVTGNLNFVNSEYRNQEKLWLPAKTDIGLSGSFSAYYAIQRTKYEWNLGCLFHGRQGVREYEFVDLEEDKFWVTTKGMHIRQNPYKRLDLRIVYTKKGGKKRQHRISLDIQNVLNTLNPGFLYFDNYLNMISRTTQLGLVPIIGYRFEY